MALNLDPSKAEHCASWMGVPLLAGDVVVGAIALLDQHNPGHFTQDDVAFLTTISSQVATAIQNSELLAQIQRTARRDRLIREITSKIRRSADIPNVLQTATQELGRSFDARYARIRIGKPEAEETEDGRSPLAPEPGRDESLGEAR
jgi:GAF domain-containing protein